MIEFLNKLLNNFKKKQCDTIEIKLEGGGSLFINKPKQYTLKYIKPLN